MIKYSKENLKTGGLWCYAKIGKDEAGRIQYSKGKDDIRLRQGKSKSWTLAGR